MSKPRRSKKRSKLVANRIVGAILILIGIGLTIVVGIPLLAAGYASRKWPSVEGQVVESGVAEKVSSLQHKRRRNRFSGEPIKIYRSDVHFTFRVGGLEYVGNVIWFGDEWWTHDRDEHEEWVVDYPAGKRVLVYYDDDDPSRSVLLPGIYFTTALHTLLGLSMVVMGAWVGFPWRRMSTPR